MPSTKHQEVSRSTCCEICMAEVFSIDLFGADFVDISVYGLLLLILIVRPTGLFGGGSVGARA